MLTNKFATIGKIIAKKFSHVNLLYYIYTVIKTNNMKKVTTFNRQNIRQINAEMEAALKAIANKYGVEVSLGSTRFTGSNFTTKVQVAAVAEGGITMSKEATDFNRYKTILGINMELGNEFERNGNTYTIVGLKPRSKKYPVLAKCSDGKTYKLPVNLVNMYA